MERFEDLIRQTQLLAEIQDPGSSRLAGMDEASAAEEGLGPMAAGVARSTILTATHTVQLNKLRCGGNEGDRCAASVMLTPTSTGECAWLLPAGSPHTGW